MNEYILFVFKREPMSCSLSSAIAMISQTVLLPSTPSSACCWLLHGAHSFYSTEMLTVRAGPSRFAIETKLFVVIPSDCCTGNTPTKVCQEVLRGLTPRDGDAGRVLWARLG